MQPQTSDDAPAATATIAPATRSTGRERADRLTDRQSADDRIEAWQRHAQDDADEIHEQTMRAREILYTGTSADAIEFANEDVAQRAAAAASRWRNR